MRGNPEVAGASTGAARGKHRLGSPTKLKTISLANSTDCLWQNLVTSHRCRQRGLVEGLVKVGVVVSAVATAKTDGRHQKFSLSQLRDSSRLYMEFLEKKILGVYQKTRIVIKVRK